MKKYTRLDVRFFRSATGNEPVREWLRGLEKEDKQSIGDDIKTVQFGWPLGMPLVDSLGSNLWEVRTKLNRGRIARVIFYLTNNTMVLVNGFIKKTTKTPKNELDLAKKRMSLFEKNDDEVKRGK